MTIRPEKLQRGMIALLLLIFLLIAAGLTLARGFPAISADNDQAVLAQAKEALIARAATDASRPGSLPCPDLLTDSDGLANHPGDGRADMLTRNACPSYVGWLPWITLDLPPATDSSGTRLWYVLSPPWRDDDNAPPLNSDTASPLMLDGDSDVTALLIAAGPALAGQNRPSQRPGDHLDGANGDGDDGIYTRGKPGDAFNDKVLPVRRSELMAAVEQRVANEVRTCLHAHAASGARPLYPWPSPLSAVSGRGMPGSRFGRLPLTQPSPGSQTQLAETSQALSQLRSRLTGTPDSNLLATLHQLDDTLAATQNLFSAMYAATSRLWQTASLNAANTNALTSELSKDLRANSNGTVSIINSEQTRIRADAAALLSPLEQLLTTLNDEGIDIFPAELQSRHDAWQQSGSLVAMDALLALLSRSYSTHADLSPLLAEALASANAARSSRLAADANPGNTAMAQLARQDSDAALNAAQTLLDGTSRYRSQGHPDEITTLANGLRAQCSAWQEVANDANRSNLQAGLNDARQRLLTLTSGASAVLAERQRASEAVAQTLSMLDTNARTGTSTAACQAASDALDKLAGVLRSNDDNLTRSSVNWIAARFKAAQQSFATQTLSDTVARVPYATALQNPAVDLDFWAKTLVARSDFLARQLKAAPATADTLPGSINALAGSAWQMEADALLAGRNAISALEKFLAGPTDARRLAVDNALTNLAQRLDSLQASVASPTLSNISSAAPAFPMIWRSAACAALQDGDSTWWTRNNWWPLAFYQISDAYSSNGRLQANGHASLPFVVVLAGRALAGQSRPSSDIAAYLEGSNAHASRNGDARTPTGNFSATPPSASSNDRIAF
jgi:hypothetical protein